MHYCYKGGGGQYHKEYDNIVKNYKGLNNYFIAQ